MNTSEEQPDWEVIAVQSQLLGTQVIQELEQELDRLRRFAKLVEGFISDRGGYITAIENCSPDNTADYWRWQGHAEARRQLLASLPWPPNDDNR
jgi:hypothetical protein